MKNSGTLDLPSRIYNLLKNKVYVKFNNHPRVTEEHEVWGKCCDSLPNSVHVTFSVTDSMSLHSMSQILRLRGAQEAGGPLNAFVKIKKEQGH